MAQHHQPCEVCGSSDGLSDYDDHTWCHVCPPETAWVGTKGSPRVEQHQVSQSFKTKPVMQGVVRSIEDRNISKKTCVKFGVTQTIAEDGSIATHSYPWYDSDKNLVGAKQRICATKDFKVTGTSENATLFGQDTCRGNGKFLTITEGEIDCMSVSEAFGNKYDVVSVRNGASAAKREIMAALEFCEGYDHVVLCFDNDDAGHKATKECLDLFSPGKLKTVSLEGKDPNAMVMAGKSSVLIANWWDAKSYTPAGIVKASDTWNAVLVYRDTPMTPYPWSGLNDILLGQRGGEVNIWAAETGVGKTQTMRELIHHIIISTEQQVGCLMLEESVAKSMLGWMSFHAERPLHKELSTIQDDELRKYWEKASAGDRFVLLDHKGWGSDIEKLKSRIRYMAKSLGCKTVVLDHLHIALSSIAGASGDWSGIDELVTQLTVLAQECDICLHVVSHVSEGRALRGSKGISKLADAVIYLERDRHNEDVEIANTTLVVVDKNRFSGDCGTAGYLRYDRNTGRMTECAKPESINEPEEF